MAFGESCCRTEKIQATLLALQCFIKFKRSNTDTAKEHSFSALCDNLFERNALFILKPYETDFMFDWQNFWVRSITCKFDPGVPKNIPGRYCPGKDISHGFTVPFMFVVMFAVHVSL